MASPNGRLRPLVKVRGLEVANKGWHASREDFATEDWVEVHYYSPQAPSWLQRTKRLLLMCVCEPHAFVQYRYWSIVLDLDLSDNASFTFLIEIVTIFQGPFTYAHGVVTRSNSYIQGV